MPLAAGRPAGGGLGSVAWESDPDLSLKYRLPRSPSPVPVPIIAAFLKRTSKNCPFCPRPWQRGVSEASNSCPPMGRRKTGSTGFRHAHGMRVWWRFKGRIRVRHHWRSRNRPHLSGRPSSITAGSQIVRLRDVFCSFLSCPPAV